MIGRTGGEEIPLKLTCRNADNASAEERRLSAEARRLGRPVRYEVRVED